jgi:hypothetical protein
MFIAMDRTKFRDTRCFSSEFLYQYSGYFETFLESTTSGDDQWLPFWNRIVEIPSKDFNTRPVPVKRELPAHDVESVFWMILLFFIRASPSSSSETLSNEDLRYRSKTFGALSNNLIDGIDGRRALLAYSEKTWRCTLHPQLRRFAPMLRAMALYFTNTWHFFPEINGKWNAHAHEAMRRILWKAIGDMGGEDIPIHSTPLKIEMAPNPTYFTMHLTTAKKRKATEYDDDNERTRLPAPKFLEAPKKKSKLVPSSSPIQHEEGRIFPLVKAGKELLREIKLSHRQGKTWLQSEKALYAGLDLCSVRP